MMGTIFLVDLSTFRMPFALMIGSASKNSSCGSCSNAPLGLKIRFNFQLFFWIKKSVVYRRAITVIKQGFDLFVCYVFSFRRINFGC